MLGITTRAQRDRQTIELLRVQLDTARSRQSTAEHDRDRALQRVELLEADTASLESQLANARNLNEQLNNQIRFPAAAPGRAA